MPTYVDSLSACPWYFKSMATDSQPPNKGVEHEPSSSRKDDRGECMQSIVVRLWQAFIAKVPVGYEDEAGFHLGKEFASH